VTVEGPIAGALIDDIGTAAPMISATLAVLALFSNARAAGLAAQAAAGLDRQTPDQLKRDVALDATLAAFALLALIGTGPLAASGFCYLDPFRTAKVVVSVFFLLYVGIGGIFFWQLNILWRRNNRLRLRQGKPARKLLKKHARPPGAPPS
jgi:hypothetical protein